MDESPQNVRVTVSRARDHVQNIRMRQGETLAVGHRNQQFPEFLWCANEHGDAGWVPERFLDMEEPNEAVARRDYDASQLTVIEGELLDVIEQVGAWVHCRNVRGAEGWVPESCLQAAVS